MQSIPPLNNLVELPALNLRQLLLLLSWLSAPIHARERAGTPRAPTAHLVHIRKDVESVLVTKRHIHKSVMRERAQRRDRRALLATTERAGADEHTGEFTRQRTGLPEPAGLVDESLTIFISIDYNKRLD